MELEKPKKIPSRSQIGDFIKKNRWYIIAGTSIGILVIVILAVIIFPALLPQFGFKPLPEEGEIYMGWAKINLYNMSTAEEINETVNIDLYDWYTESFVKTVKNNETFLVNNITLAYINYGGFYPACRLVTCGEINASSSAKDNDYILYPKLTDKNDVSFTIYKINTTLGNFNSSDFQNKEEFFTIRILGEVSETVCQKESWGVRTYNPIPIRNTSLSTISGGWIGFNVTGEISNLSTSFFWKDLNFIETPEYNVTYIMPIQSCWLDFDLTFFLNGSIMNITYWEGEVIDYSNFVQTY